jgi:hypothetical protein
MLSFTVYFFLFIMLIRINPPSCFANSCSILLFKRIAKVS